MLEKIKNLFKKKEDTAILENPFITYLMNQKIGRWTFIKYENGIVYMVDEYDSTESKFPFTMSHVLKYIKVERPVFYQELKEKFPEEFI